MEVQQKEVEVQQKEVEVLLKKEVEVQELNHWPHVKVLPQEPIHILTALNTTNALLVGLHLRSHVLEIKDTITTLKTVIGHIMYHVSSRTISLS